MTDTHHDADFPEHYPAQRRLVNALDDHDIDVTKIRTRSGLVRISIPVEDARRLTALLKETHDHR